MKKTSKILCIILTLLFALQSSVVALAATSKCIFNSNTYTHNSKFDDYDILQGIDVSYHDGKIDFKAVKKAGVEFVIIRVGYRGYGKSGSLNADPNFAVNMKNAIDAGLPVGVYFYSQALNEVEAIAEANFTLQKIKGYKLDLPVVFDYEFADVSTGRLDSAWKNKTINKSKMTNNTLAFCRTIKNAGYEPMVYANMSFLNTNIDHKVIENNGYPVWLAHYTTKTAYDGEYCTWQFSSTGKINGISSKVDCNFMYVNNNRFTVSSVSNKEYTGTKIQPDITVSYSGEVLTKDKDYTIKYSNNTNIGTAKITVTGINDYSDINTTAATFKIVPKKVANISLTERNTTSIKTKWDKISNADGYQVQVHRSTGWETAGTTASTSFSIPKLATAANYYFRVRSYKTVNGIKYYGAYSNNFYSTTKPSQVTDIAYTSSTNHIKLTWKKQQYATSYRIYKYNTKTKAYTLYKEISGGDNNNITITDLSANSTYHFKVAAYKIAQDGTKLLGERSKAITVYTKPSAPIIKTAASSASKRIKVSWKKVASVSGYQIMWSTTKDFSSDKKAVTFSGASTTSKTITTTKAKRTYYVRVRAYKTRNNKKIYSPWSSTLSVKVK